MGGSALGFRDLTDYIARSVFERGGLRPTYTLDHEDPIGVRQQAGGRSGGLSRLGRVAGKLWETRLTLPYRTRQARQPI
jgi:hypothetical protein